MRVPGLVEFRYKNLDVAYIKSQLEAKADPNIFDGISPAFDTPMTWAIVNSDGDTQKEVIKILLEAKVNINVRGPHHCPLIELALTCNNRGAIQTLLAANPSLSWYDGKNFATALTPFFKSVIQQNPQLSATQLMGNLSILTQLFKGGAGAIPQVFHHYDALAKSETYCKYVYIALFGYFFISSTWKLENQEVLFYLNTFLLRVLSKIIIEYVEEDKFLEDALKRLLHYVGTNSLKGEWDEHPRQTVLIEEKESDLSPLDRAVKTNPATKDDDLNARFERVKIVTDGLKESYRLTLLGMAQRIQQAKEGESFPALSAS